MSVIGPERRGLKWRTARASGGGGCVEVAPAADLIAVRVLLYTAHEWACFLDGAKNGEFDDLLS